MPDLTDFLSGAIQVATAYAGRPQVQYVNQGQPQGYAPGQGFAMDGGTVIEGAQMVYDCASGPPPKDCGGSAVYKKVCGEYRWVYPKRRRRRQLLTKSDAAGLAQLKGIVGAGKVMESWIATHPS